MHEKMLLFGLNEGLKEYDLFEITQMIKNNEINFKK
jgi:hypothetical protein